VREDEGVPFFLDPALTLVGLLSVGLLVLKLWALIDCATRPAPAFEAHGKLSKVIWLVILAAALLFNSVFGILGLAGTVAAIVYLVDVRPAVRGSS
jgi:hypothetical protein